ncbi:MAG TPA: 3-hydroxyacyl-CoA dehydrogenase family protein [Ktedonobacteraceae bacterium]|nr:3-hydroxyacyl-CoA dehydrogenase family protein [Ktedonobacteraceae bacterium]
MTIDDIKLICVVGAGTMGSQIALQCAMHGYKVNLTDADEAFLERGIAGDQALLKSRVSKGRMTQEEADATLQRLTPVKTLEEAAGQADFVIEAVFENLEVKQELFARLDKICPQHTILASNSSTIMISKIAQVIERKDRAVNMHFFHPATYLKLVEVVKGPDSSEESAEITMELARRIGKEPVLLRKEIPGFIVNYILHSLTEAALHLYTEGIASYQDIDKALKLGLNHPMGPFELADFSGVDIMYKVMQMRYKESGDPADKPPAFLEEMMQENRLGRKTGRGFYEYNKEK